MCQSSLVLPSMLGFDSSSYAEVKKKTVVLILEKTSAEFS